MAGIPAQESLVRRQMRILNMSEKDKKSIIEQRILNYVDLGPRTSSDD